MQGLISVWQGTSGWRGFVVQSLPAMLPLFLLWIHALLILQDLELNLAWHYSHEKLSFSRTNIRKAGVAGTCHILSHSCKLLKVRAGLLFHWEIKYSEPILSVFLASSPYPAHCWAWQPLENLLACFVTLFPSHCSLSISVCLSVLIYFVF